jgi:hypothetical protein
MNSHMGVQLIISFTRRLELLRRLHGLMRLRRGADVSVVRPRLPSRRARDRLELVVYRLSWPPASARGDSAASQVVVVIVVIVFDAVVVHVRWPPSPAHLPLLVQPAEQPVHARVGAVEHLALALRVEGGQPLEPRARGPVRRGGRGGRQVRELRGGAPSRPMFRRLMRSCIPSSESPPSITLCCSSRPRLPKAEAGDKPPGAWAYDARGGVVSGPACSNSTSDIGSPHSADIAPV